MSACVKLGLECHVVGTVRTSEVVFELRQSVYECLQSMKLHANYVLIA